MNRIRLASLAAAALLLSGCYTAPVRPPALDGARSAVDAARANPQVATYAPAELQEAVAAYQRAEALLRSDGDMDQVRHLSYLAMQRATIAQEVLGRPASAQTLEALAKGLEGKEPSGRMVASLVLSSPDFQRR